MATDIAFSLGILSLLGSRIPHSIKIFLTAFAIIDDLGAILIIAIFYTDSLNFLNLGLAVLTLLVMILLNNRKVNILWIYLVLGAFFAVRNRAPIAAAVRSLRRPPAHP